MSLNQAQLIGFLGDAPDVRYTSTGKAVAVFDVATDRKWTDADGEKHEETEWHRVTCFGKLAESVDKFLRKGRQVFVQGELRTEKYTDKDGIVRYSTKVYADQVQFLGPKTNDVPEPASDKADKPNSDRNRGQRSGSRRADG